MFHRLHSLYSPSHTLYRHETTATMHLVDMVMYSYQHANNAVPRHPQTTKKPLRYSTNAATDASLSNHSVTCYERAGKIQRWPRSANWKKAWVEIVSSPFERGKGGRGHTVTFVKVLVE